MKASPNASTTRVPGAPRLRRVVGALVTLAAAASLSACSGPGGETTCEEFAAMSRSERNNVLSSMLEDNDLAAGNVSNMYGVRENVQNYCGFLMAMENTEAGQNADQPIENAVDWSSTTW